MKKNVSKRVLSAFLAFVMVFLMVPISAINIWAVSLPDNLPLEFQVTSKDGVVTYNIPTANMTYDFYIAARAYIDDNASELAELKGDSFSFMTNGNTYELSSIYAYKPSRSTWNNTCGAFTGIFNYKFVENGEEKIKHVAMVAFRGTDGASDIMTDLDFADEQGYHNGFFKTARNHYNHMIDKVSYELGNGNNMSFGDYLKEMKNGNPDYTMIVTGHSLGGAVANIFTSYWLQEMSEVNNTNVVAYTYGSPCTCSKEIAEFNKVDNVFNFVNAYDWVPKVGYGGINPKIYITPSVKASGYRQGIDFVYAKGDSDYGSRVPCSFTNHKMKVYSEVKDEVNLYISSTYPEETPPTAEDLLDMPKFEYSAAETGIARFLELYKPAYEAKSAAIKSLLSGESPHTAVVKAVTAFFGIEIESETDKAIERMEEKIQEIHLSINEMQKDIDKIQESIDAMATSIEVAKNEIIGTIEGTDRGNKLSSFTINYITKLNQVNYDYGNLIIALENGVESDIKTMYDQLYVSSSELSTYVYQNVAVFSVSGGLTTDPVQEILYKQYLASGLEPTENCQAFITDIYTGYAFSEYCLWLCNTQQVFWIAENDATTYYNDFSGRTTPKATVVKEWESFKAEHLAILEALTAFEAELNDDVRNSSVSHFVSNHSITQQTTLDTSNNNIVEAGDLIYLNNVVYELYNESSKTQLNWFDDIGKFSYEIADGNELATVNDSGVLKILDSAQTGHEFTVKLNYQPNEKTEEVEVASWKFEIGKEHPWYGQGTEKEPFIIATADDLKAFVNSEKSKYTADNEYYFILLNDIDLQGEKLNALSSFKGVLDGCGHAIYGFELNTTALNVGFINQNNGTIKNLTIGSDAVDYFNITNHGTKSVKVYRSLNENSGHYYYSGALVGNNNKNGVIQNCHITNVYVGCDLYDVNDNDTLYCVVGGLVGFNSGKIEGCSVQNSRIAAYTPTVENSGDDNHAYAGGFIGKLSEGVIADCLSINNSIEAAAEGDGYNKKFEDPNYAFPCSIACGFVAEMHNGTIQNSFVYGNEIISKAYALYNYTDASGQWKGVFSCKNTSATLINCTDDVALFKCSLNESNSWILDDEIPSLNDYVGASVSFTKTNYCLGECFDPSTIWVYLIDKQGNVSEENYTHFSYEVDTLGDVGSYVLKVYTYGNNTKDITINVIEHTFNDGTISIPATHLKAGELTKNCVNCSVTETEIIEPTPDHTFGDWQPFSDSQHYRTCACDETEYAAHHWDAGVVTLEPTYTTEGIRTYTCEDCGATETEMIPIVQPDYIPGDINGDGIVNTKDTTRLMRYLAGWNVEVNEAALDVNGDGIVNTKDTTRLMRYLAGWDVEIY